MSHDPSELPWNEEQWLRFMQEADARAARFGELLETLSDDENAGEIIAREMGWDHLLAGGDEVFDDADDEERFDPRACIEEAMAEVEAERLARGDDEDDDDERTIDEMIADDRDERRSIPAYARAYDWGLAVHLALRPWVQAEFAENEDPDPDEPLIVAYGESLVVAAKLVAGHGMGYDDDSICGNIVCCRKSLAAAENSLAAMDALQASGSVDAAVLAPLIAEGREVRRAVEERIAELRSRVWWQ